MVGVWRQGWLVCGDKGGWCVATRVVGVWRQEWLVCGDKGGWCVAARVVGVFGSISLEASAAPRCIAFHPHHSTSFAA